MVRVLSFLRWHSFQMPSGCFREGITWGVLPHAAGLRSCEWGKANHLQLTPRKLMWQWKIQRLVFHCHFHYNVTFTSSNSTPPDFSLMLKRFPLLTQKGFGGEGLCAMAYAFQCGSKWDCSGDTLPRASCTVTRIHFLDNFKGIAFCCRYMSYHCLKHLDRIETCWTEVIRKDSRFITSPYSSLIILLTSSYSFHHPSRPSS